MGGQQFGRHGPLQAYFLSLIPSGLTPEEKRRDFCNGGTESSRPSREDPFPRFQNDGSCTKKAPDAGSFFVCRFPGKGTIFRNTALGEPGGPDERRTCSPFIGAFFSCQKRTARPFPWLSDQDAGSAISIRCSATPGSTCRSRPPHEKQRRAAPRRKKS